MTTAATTTQQTSGAVPACPRPRISVVTPSFNQGPYIERCIQSVLAQNYPNFEHIVFDNCSNDETLAVLRRYPHLDWTSRPDRGQSDALNQACRKARGEIVAWINADDFYLPGAFDLAARTLARGTGEVAMAGRVRVVDTAGALRELVAPVFDGLDYLVDFWSHPYGLTQPGVLFRRELLDVLGPFRTDLHYAMDYDFWLRLAARGHRVKLVDADIAGYILHDESKTVQGRHTMCFWDDMERCSRRYWGPWHSARRRHLARGFNRQVAERLAGVLIHLHKSGAQFDWSLVRRLLRCRPQRFADRHLLAVLAEQLLGPTGWRCVQALRGRRTQGTGE